MTLIVAVRHETGVVLGADSITHEGERLLVRAVPKLWLASPHIAVGTAGACRFTDVFRLVKWPSLSGLGTEAVAASLSRDIVPQLRDPSLDVEKRNGWAVVAVDADLFYIGCDLSVTALDEQYTALGSAEMAALGALYAMGKYAPTINARERVISALEAGRAHISGILPPWVVVDTRIPDAKTAEG